MQNIDKTKDEKQKSFVAESYHFENVLIENEKSN